MNDLEIHLRKRLSRRNQIGDAKRLQNPAHGFVDRNRSDPAPLSVLDDGIGQLLVIKREYLGRRLLSVAVEMEWIELEADDVVFFNPAIDIVNHPCRIERIDGHRIDPHATGRELAQLSTLSHTTKAVKNSEVGPTLLKQRGINLFGPPRP